MSLTTYDAYWNSCANHNIMYSEDFNELLVLIPENIDNSASAGATLFDCEINISNFNKSSIRITDNGSGLSAKGEKRFFSFASSKADSINNRYGTGGKIPLTKLKPNYHDSKIIIKSRRKNKDLIIYDSLFETATEDFKVDEEDNKTLYPSGFQIEVPEFDAEVFGTFDDRFKLSNAIKEIICSRYNRKFLDNLEFNFKITDKKGTIIINSKKECWITLEEAVIEECKIKDKNKFNAKKLIEKVFELDGGKAFFTLYSIDCDGRKNFKLKELFEKFGSKNQDSSRLHIALNGRFIEAKRICEVLKKTNHNVFNNLIGFLNFIPTTENDFEKMPKPSTIKTSFRDNDKVLNGVLEKIGIIMNNNKKTYRNTTDDISSSSESEEDVKISKEKKVEDIKISEEVNPVENIKVEESIRIKNTRKVIKPSVEEVKTKEETKTSGEVKKVDPPKKVVINLKKIEPVKKEISKDDIKKETQNIINVLVDRVTKDEDLPDIEILTKIKSLLKLK